MIERGEITAAFGFVAILGFFLFLASVLGGCGGRCDSSSCIGIDPIEPPPEECEGVYDQGFQDGVDSVECECDDDWTDVCDEDVPPGHLRKECRGKPHAALGCDDDCDVNDPICIPCDLGDFA